MKQKYKSLTLAPFSYSNPSLGTSSIFAICLFIPQIVFLFISKSYLSVIQIFVAVLAFISPMLSNINTSLEKTNNAIKIQYLENNYAKYDNSIEVASSLED